MTDISALPGNEQAKVVFRQLERAMQDALESGVDPEAALTALLSYAQMSLLNMGGVDGRRLTLDWLRDTAAWIEANHMGVN